MNLIKIRKLDETITGMDERDPEIESLIDYVCSIKVLAMDTIHSIENNDFQSILFKRYIESKSFNQIGKEMGIPLSSIVRLHFNSLSEYQRISL